MDKSKLCVDAFNRRALLYQQKYMDVSLYSQSLDLFCSLIKTENASVLELACGPGNITKYLLDKRPDLNILGTDLAPRMLELAKENNPSAEFAIMDCRQISSLTTKYEAVLCGFGLPYLTMEEARKFIKDVSERLLSGGVFYLSTMEADYNNSTMVTSPTTGDKIFIHYYQESDLKSMLEESGLRLLNLERKLNNEDIDLILVAKK